MKRRSFFGAGVVGLAGAAAAAGAAEREGNAPAESLTDEERRTAPPCGLFCEACSEKGKGRCHGCGCTCRNCTASKHAPTCTIFACARERRVESCADCAEFACTNLVMHACDPIWHTHKPCIENLRRRKKIGTKAWIAEQRKYWADEDNRTKLHFVEAECQEKVRRLKQQGGYKRPW